MEKFIPTPTISEILKEEFMDPLGLSAYRLAKDIHVPVSRIQEILNGTRSISADTSLRLPIPAHGMQEMPEFGASDNGVDVCFEPY